MQIITISGLDGSGKSTQIEKLKSWLESQGKKVFYFHVIQFGLANKFYRKNQRKNNGSVTNASFCKVILRRIFLMIDIFRFKSLCKKLAKEGYDYLVSDRYFYDNVINIKYLSKNRKKIPCEKNIPKPDLAIYLSADPEIIMQRERKPDQGMEYLKYKKELLDSDSSAWGLKLIDGNRSQEEVFEEIKRLIK